MVVSRKASATAPAPVSRTNSSQPIPRKQKQHQLQEQEIPSLKKNAQAPASTSPGGGSSNKLRKSKPNFEYIKEQRSTGSTTFLDKLFFLSLFLFALYSAVVCPQHAHDINASQTPATCRALFAYRTHVLEPYLLPPFKSAYNSPLVQPYAHKLEGVAYKVDSAVRPWYRHALLPRWRQHVIPRYHQVVAVVEPRYHQAIEHIKEPLKPHLSQVNVYVSKAQRAIQLYLNLFKKTTAPYIALAQRNWALARPHVEAALLATRQALCKAWALAKPHLITGANKAQVYGKLGLKYALDARRSYVDPHIKKILEQVNGNGKKTTEAVLTTITPTEPESAPSALEPTSTKAQETESIPTTVLKVPEVVDTAPGPAPPEGVDEEFKEITPDATASETVTTSSTPAPTSVKAEATASAVQREIEEELRAISVAEESARAAASIAASDIEEALAEPTGPAKELEQEVKAHLSGLGANAQKTPEVVDDLELDDFLSELGLEPETPILDTVDAPAPEPTPEVQEEEQPIPVEEDTRTEEEKRKAAVAAKRKNIVERHIEWQRQLDALFDVQEKRVYVDLEGIRNWAVSELGDEFAPKVTEQPIKAPGLPESRYKRAKIAKGEGLGSKALEGLNKQGGRFIRGLETYVGSLESRKNGWSDKTPEQLSQIFGKEREKWDGVLDKVEEKFGKLVNDVQGDIHKWYMGMKAREAEVMQEAADAIRVLAEQAQADIAMDYAWLDDVSTKDWANYHELMTTYEDFQQTALAIQNGTYIPEGVFIITDPEAKLIPPADPLVTALNNLQAEWNDVVLGFQLSVQNLKKRTLEILSVASPEAEEGTFRIKNEKGKRVDDMRDYLAQAKERLENGMNEVVGDEGRVVIGKDPVVVQENLKKAPVEHVEL